MTRARGFPDPWNLPVGEAHWLLPRFRPAVLSELGREERVERVMRERPTAFSEALAVRASLEREREAA